MCFRFVLGLGWGGVGAVHVRVHLQSQWMLRCALREVDATLPVWGWSGVGWVMLYVSQWQWRWMSASPDLFTKTGKRLYKDAVHGFFPQWLDGFHMEWK